MEVATMARQPISEVRALSAHDLAILIDVLKARHA